MSIAIYPGSFDPITKGHVNIIQRALYLFDHVIVTVAVNVTKKSWLSVEERVTLIKTVFAENEQVSVKPCDMLSVEFAKQHQANFIVRGLRLAQDYDHEFQLASMNRHLNAEIETVLLPSDPELAYLSSTIVREIAAVNGDISVFVPEEVVSYLQK